MVKKYLPHILILILISLGVQLSATADTIVHPQKTELKFHISYARSVLNELADDYNFKAPLTGRAYAIITRTDAKEPRLQVVRARCVPFWGTHFSKMKPGESTVIDDSVFGFPLKSIAEIPAGDYFVQGFINIYTKFKRSDGHTIWMHMDQWEGQKWSISPGNLFSDVKKVHIDPSKAETIEITCNHVIPPIEVPRDTQYVKRIKFKSEILSKFWGHPIYLGATILLPEGYEEHPDVSYPVNYIQGHFSLRSPYGFQTDPPEGEDSRGRGKSGYDFHKYWTSDTCPRMIAVTFQHPCPYYDDSYAVNSANVGPYGDALLEELIPYVEEHFRIIRKPYARVLSGGSTGGWESFALQVLHPDFFGGTFPSCPDSLDFNYYQIVNIYEHKNAYYEEYEWLKVERPDIRNTDGSITEMMKDENHFERVIGDKTRGGGQWDIWEAVYSPVGADGYPQPIWDKMTGEIDKKVAQYWKENWDMTHYLRKNWSWLGPKLKGKLHVYVGDMDNCYLNNAVVLLEEFLESTTDPYYAGTVKYGDRQPHCWGPRGKEAIILFSDYVTKIAPEGENTKTWKY